MCRRRRRRRPTPRLWPSVTLLGRRRQPAARHRPCTTHLWWCRCCRSVEPAWWCESRVGQAVVGPVGVRGYPAARDDRSHGKKNGTNAARTHTQHTRAHTHSNTKSLSADGRRPRTRVKNDTSAHAHTYRGRAAKRRGQKKCQCDFSRVRFSTKL